MKNIQLNKTALSIVVGLFMLSGFVTANQNDQTRDPQKTDKKPQKSVVDYESDVARQIEGDSAIRLVGNVIFHHNGAIIQCDSALRYDKYRMDCFGNVIINQDSTYIYGTKATYDGRVDMATVHDQLIKITNGKQTVMYTYALTFNTKSKIGEFSGGGVILQRDNVMESERGQYFSSTNDVVLYEHVSMRNDNYKVRTDSLKFNLDTEITTFLTKTYIWDKDKDFLTSKSGTYNNKTRTYTFTQEAYLLTQDQEVWADSIIYQSLTREAFLRRNIQILDSTQKTLAFGDWGYYNDSIKKAILSKTPSVRSWEEKRDSLGKITADTAYLRADSIYFETFPRGTTKPQPVDSLAAAAGAAGASGGASQPADSLAAAAGGTSGQAPQPADSLAAAAGGTSGQAPQPADSLAAGAAGTSGGAPQPVDSLAVRENMTKNSKLTDSTSTHQITDLLAHPKDNTINHPNADSAMTPIRNSKMDSLIGRDSTNAARDQANAKVGTKNEVTKSETEPNKTGSTHGNGGKPMPYFEPVILDTTRTYRADTIVKKREKSASKTNGKSTQKSANKNTAIPARDSVSAHDEHTMATDSSTSDSMKPAQHDTASTLASDSILGQFADSLWQNKPDSTINKKDTDTVERLIRAFRNVKAFREDIQGSCDSLVGYSVDSTTSMFGHPILWSKENQISAEQIDVYTKNEQVDWADFIGTPFLIQQVDTSKFNQAVGRMMQAYFKKNELELAHMKGNVKNFYWWEEDLEVVAFASIECAELEMYFKKRAPTKMKWIGEAEWVIFPIDQIPDTQPLKLDGFRWITDTRPKSPADICIRIERETMRTEAEGYHKPEFNIETKINAYKAKLLKEGTWRDRVDQTTVTSDHFQSHLTE